MADANNALLCIEWIFGEPFVLNDKNNDFISIQISDDLSEFVEFTAQAIGKTRET